jgi:hypothetical protein
MLTSNEDPESLAASGLAVVDGAGGVALSNCWAPAAAGTIQGSQLPALAPSVRALRLR